MACELPTFIPWKIRSLHGEKYSVKVKATWKIKDVRERVRTQLGISEYEQGYIQGSSRMRSGDFLVHPEEYESDDPPDTILVRSTIPSSFSKADAMAMWQSFLALSDDDGDTVHWGSARASLVGAARLPSHAVLLTFDC
eukprot:TRINITY_DN12472_c1_g1_i1.p1 TRINITY_DN12472_c1_g1~~TRINITY_DN12472_c1_g1_i1.p1  ORF type:complete len:139 (+),score=13.21 TRINITY_DN12472_c1_g1_i1:203-619(+)